MTERQLLQYYMAFCGDALRFCKHSAWDRYSYDCPYEEDFHCINCEHWDPDLEEACAEAEKDIPKYF